MDDNQEGASILLFEIHQQHHEDAGKSASLLVMGLSTFYLLNFAFELIKKIEYFNNIKRMYDVTKLSDATEGGVRKVSFATCERVCSKQIDIEIEGDAIRKIKYTGGCHGNTQGVARLCEGMKVADVIDRLEGIDCKGRGTSCPDQLAKALRQL